MGKVNHAARKHALLSASGASRWLNCTPSARLEDKVPNRSSKFAEEGTLAHELSDIIIRNRMGLMPTRSFNAELKKIKANELFYDNMIDEVMVYVDYVFESFENAKKRSPDAVMQVEERVDFSHLVEQGFGTGDNQIIADSTLEIIDLKFGKGVQVDAENNEQLMLYASGALRAHEIMYDISEVKMTIVQPRLNHISSWTISVDDLIEWGEKVVKPKAKLAYLGEGEKAVGPWCKFCKVKATCRAIGEHNLSIAKHEFKDPDHYSIEELVDIKAQSTMLKEWIDSIDEYLRQQAMTGKKIPGFKLVEGRTQRRWGSEVTVLEKLEKLYPREQLINTKLKSITDIEKLMGKKLFLETVGSEVVKPIGAPTLVPVSDKRPEWEPNTAADDFSEID